MAAFFKLTKYRLSSTLPVGGVERGERNISLINIVELGHAPSIKTATLLQAIG